MVLLIYPAKWRTRILHICVHIKLSWVLEHVTEVSSLWSTAHDVNATAEGSAVVCIQGGSGSGSEKSIKSVSTIRRCIHLKGQTCLKQTAGDVCRYYIICVLNLLKVGGTNNQQTGICMQMEAWGFYNRFICFFFMEQKYMRGENREGQHMQIIRVNVCLWGRCWCYNPQLQFLSLPSHC